MSFIKKKKKKERYVSSENLKLGKKTKCKRKQQGSNVNPET